MNVLRCRHIESSKCYSIHYLHAWYTFASNHLIHKLHINMEHFALKWDKFLIIPRKMSIWQINSSCIEKISHFDQKFVFCVYTYTLLLLLFFFYRFNKYNFGIQLFVFFNALHDAMENDTGCINFTRIHSPNWFVRDSLPSLCIKIDEVKSV